MVYISGGKEHAATYDYSSENVRLVSYVALNCKTLEGFAGVMRKYCSNRRGPIFTDVFRQLLASYGDSNPVDAATKKQKLMALLENHVSTATATKAIYEDMNQCYSLSLDGQLKGLEQFIDGMNVDQIGLQNRGKLAVYCRGISLTPERQSRRKRNHRYVLKAFHDN